MNLKESQFIRIKAAYHGTLFEVVEWSRTCRRRTRTRTQLKVLYTRTVAGKRLLKADAACRKFIVRETIEQMWSEAQAK